MAFPVFTPDEINSIKQMDYMLYFDTYNGDNTFLVKMYNTLPLMYDEEPEVMKKEERSSFLEFSKNPGNLFSFYWLLLNNHLDTDYNPETKMLSEVNVLQPSELQTAFVKANPDLRFDKSSWFRDLDRDLAERFYYVWNQLGRPKIEVDPRFKHSLIKRPHINPLMKVITLGDPGDIRTIVDELSHIAELNYYPSLHSMLDGVMTSEELFDKYNRYHIPGTLELMAHYDVQPLLFGFILDGTPTKYIPKTPISTLGNTISTVSNILPPSLWKPDLYRLLWDWFKLLIK